MARRSSNQVVVPECRQALNQMKYELAAELGLVSQASFDTEFAGELGTSANSGYGRVQWDSITTRDAGYIGGNITKRLVQQAEQLLNGSR
ncbi:alpha/beta-type small acid-soluble spore protein [Paenibacillus cisolokensis]|jgi:Small, acid-soluble spore proteins, alpha/beta type.|uniref:Small acid-soluble spore protein n=1 Tax=Paenibacillus cisolokensis TaxID=1658519 RepID=A0ABQ4N746_9BACL|nr:MULTISPECIES: alpha/beta-type small acid-soluble spore protein [Paenibacillus]ALS26072.1 spore protein [Paenibacillus sp. 32O-W]GIQ64011.1 small acid-soluble spore protein [Paenibacillus cisolokensis]